MGKAEVGRWARAHIYSATQTAARTVVAGVTMEALLTQRVAIGAQRRELIAPQAEAVGVQVISAGVMPCHSSLALRISNLAFFGIAESQRNPISAF